GSHEDVPRLDVPVNEALLLEDSEGLTHAPDDVQGGQRLERPRAGQPLEEVLALDELHGEVEVLAVLARIDGVNEVLVIELRQRARLPQETVGQPGVLRET